MAGERHMFHSQYRTSSEGSDSWSGDPEIARHLEPGGPSLFEIAIDVAQGEAVGVKSKKLHLEPWRTQFRHSGRSCKH